jgi:hypothetical protein
VGLAYNEESDRAKERGCTSPKVGGAADVVIIGFSVDLARSATWSAAIVEVARSSVADGISTSSTSPLEVSLVCKRKWLADPNGNGLA